MNKCFYYQRHKGKPFICPFSKVKKEVKPRNRLVLPEGLNPYKEVNRYAKKSKS